MYLQAALMLIQHKFYGQFGGQFVPENLLNALNELEEAFLRYKDDPEFLKEYNYYLKQYVGRENPLYFAERLTEYAGGCKIYLKREDLNHTGAHKINNAIGQVLLAKRMGKKRNPIYRVVIADARSPRDGRNIDEAGFYDPNQAALQSNLTKKQQKHG